MSQADERLRLSFPQPSTRQEDVLRVAYRLMATKGMHRMTVQDVLEYLAAGMTTDEILADFPDLTADDIRACLAFAADRERRLRVIPAA